MNINMEDLMKITFDILDKVDILSMLEENKEVEVFSLMDRLMEILKSEVEKYPELEGCLFNGVNEVEFIDYLRKRYKEKIYNREISIYYVGKRK